MRSLYFVAITGISNDTVWSLIAMLSTTLDRYKVHYFCVLHTFVFRDR
jgi:hypothetical protein